MQRWINQLQNLKVSTPEEFDALVKKIEVVADNNPASYRGILRLLAGLGYAYIFTVFLLLLLSLWGVRQVLIYTQGYALIGQLNGIVGLIFIGILSLFFVRFKAPNGIALTHEQVPQLFAVIDELSTALKAPKLDKVILNDELNAAILQRPRYGFIGWQTNYLLVGLPLMQALSPDQYKAVLAHELAHLCGDDGRVSAWIYRIRCTWYELAERFEHNGRGGFLFQRFFRWYGPFFRAYSFVHARSQEYEADRRAAELVGVDHKAEALIWLHVNSALLSQQFWPMFQRSSMVLKTPPIDFVSQVLASLKAGIDPDQSQQWLALSLAHQTDNTSTHPCIAERIAALGYTLPTPLVPPSERATCLLGDQLDSLTEQLNRLWKTEETDAWKDRYDRNQHQLNRLKSLNTKAENLLTTEERIKRATLTWLVQDKKLALPQFLSIIELDPNHTVARYWVGFLLLEQQSDRGVSHLQFALKYNPSLVISACRRLYSFYLKQDQPTLAERYKRQWQQHEKAWNLAQSERNKIDNNIRFITHDLPISEIRQIVEQLSTYPEIKAVYLARKVVERFPEYPHYVIGITRRYYRAMDQDYKPDDKLRGLIESGLALSKDYRLWFLSESEQWRSVKHLEGALIYHHQAAERSHS